MFPDVPANIELLRALLESQKRGELNGKLQFVIISHAGITYERTIEVLNSLELVLDTVTVVAIVGVSDPQIDVLLPILIKKDDRIEFSDANWASSSLEHKRKYGKTWFEKFVSNTLKYPKQNTIVGLIDIFRANQDHVDGLIDICEKNGFHQFRLIDTAGSAFTEQIDEVVPRLIKKYANCSFFGHFHNDFGLATELMVPGRMEKQVDGWRRIGLADNDMNYLYDLSD